MKERIAFLGGKGVGVGILHDLARRENVVCAISNPSDAGTSWFPRVWPIAEREKIPYATSDVNHAINFLRALEPDWIVCAYYDKILSPDVLAIPKRGAINVHMGLAEEYRGCYPTTFPIIDGRRHAGVTIHKMERGIDNGDIYTQGTTNVEKDETGKSLYDKCTELAIRLFALTWDRIKSGKLTARPQATTRETVYHKRSDFPSHEMNLLWPLEKLDRYVRALTFPPFPRPYFVINGRKFEIHYTK